MKPSRLARIFLILSTLLPAIAVSAGAPERGTESAATSLRISADSDVFARIHQANLNEIELGLLGLQKASSADVKDYAQMLLQDHQLADQKLVQTALAA